MATDPEPLVVELLGDDEVGAPGGCHRSARASTPLLTVTAVVVMILVGAVLVGAVLVGVVLVGGSSRPTSSSPSDPGAASAGQSTIPGFLRSA